MDQIAQADGSWLTSEEAAAYVGLKGKFRANTLNRWARLKLITRGRAGRTCVYQKDDLDRLILSMGKQK